MKRSFSNVAAVICALSVLVIGQHAFGQYHWSPAQIQGLNDVTPGFHGGAGQLSTINSITPTARGIQLDITYEIGQEADPFAENYGLGFARVSLQSGDLGGLDVSGFSSSDLEVTTSINITAQSFLQTDFMENGGSIDDGDGTPDESFSFYFWEHNDGIAAGAPTVADFDFSMGNEFGDWDLPSPQQVQGLDNIRQWGVQLADNSGSLVVGQPVNATITIESQIPEPAALTLVGVTMLGMLGIRRRRKA